MHISEKFCGLFCRFKEFSGKTKPSATTENNPVFLSWILRLPKRKAQTTKVVAQIQNPHPLLPPRSELYFSFRKKLRHKTCCCNPLPQNPLWISATMATTAWVFRQISHIHCHSHLGFAIQPFLSPLEPRKAWSLLAESHSCIVMELRIMREDALSNGMLFTRGYLMWRKGRGLEVCWISGKMRGGVWPNGSFQELLRSSGNSSVSSLPLR